MDIKSYGGQAPGERAAVAGTPSPDSPEAARVDVDHGGGTGPPLPARPPRPARVLVVDDEPVIARIVARILPEHDVAVEHDAAAALDRLLGGRAYDVVLCDLMMPQMTGMELHRRLSAVAPAEAAKMVFMTGGAFTPEAQAFLRAVPNARIAKPFDASGLRALVAARVAAAAEVGGEAPPTAVEASR